MVTMPSIEPFDVIIFGGGPAGAAAAITLAGRGIRTVIIEPSDYSALRVGETLPPAIRNILTHLGVWRTFLKDGHIESVSIRSAWGSAKPFDSDHIYNPYHSGWHIDRARFDRMLATAASNAGAILFTQVHISNLSHDSPSGWQVVILQDKCSRCLQAPFIIDATGQKSAIPMGLFRSYHVVDHLIGIVRFLARLAHPYTLVEAEADGWWYSAPLPGHRLVVAHMTDADLVVGSGYNINDYWNHKLVQLHSHSHGLASKQCPLNLKSYLQHHLFAVLSLAPIGLPLATLVSLSIHFRVRESIMRLKEEYSPPKSSLLGFREIIRHLLNTPTGSKASSRTIYICAPQSIAKNNAGAVLPSGADVSHL